MKRRLLHEVYLLGYSGWRMPRWLRRIAAGTQWHRAWLCGFLGCFTQDDGRHGTPVKHPQRLRRLRAQ
jgi:hypothetical protein